MHDGLAESVRRGDEDNLVEAGLRVEREHHARRTFVAADHPLDACGERNLGGGEALVDPIGDRAVVIKRRKHLFNRMKYILYTTDIKISFLLSSKGGIGQIFGCRRRPYRK